MTGLASLEKGLLRIVSGGKRRAHRGDRRAWLTRLLDSDFGGTRRAGTGAGARLAASCAQSPARKSQYPCN